MKRIPLNHQKFALVDDEDFERLSLHHWSYMHNDARGYGYASRTKTINGKRRVIRMHNEILLPVEEQQVDHINHNALDNRKSNLRLCSRSQNMQNRGTFKNNRLGLKGIRRREYGYDVRIHVEGVSKYIGYFVRLEDAKKASLKARLTYHKEFAHGI